MNPKMTGTRITSTWTDVAPLREDRDWLGCPKRSAWTPGACTDFPPLRCAPSAHGHSHPFPAFGNGLAVPGFALTLESVPFAGNSRFAKIGWIRSTASWCVQCYDACQRWCRGTAKEAESLALRAVFCMHDARRGDTKRGSHAWPRQVADRSIRPRDMIRATTSCNG